MDDLRLHINIVNAYDELQQSEIPDGCGSYAPVLSETNLLYHQYLHGNYFKDLMKQTHDTYAEAGVLLHNLFFEQMSPPERCRPMPIGLIAFIEKYYSSVENFKTVFSKIASDIRGSGWCCLHKDGNISTISNHKIVHDVVLIVDMWEHSYYYDYGPNKGEYISNYWDVVNWDVINNRLNS